METPQTLSRPEVQALVAWLATHKPKYGGTVAKWRNHGLIVFMLETGLRVGELVKLVMSDVWFRDQPVRTLMVREEIAKTHVARGIPVSQSLRREIILMTMECWGRILFDANAWIWTRSTRPQPLTTRAVEVIVRQAGLAALGRPVNPHMLRHTFASEMMRVTNARIVQELLGHADLRSTQIYTHPNGDDLADAIAAKDARGKETIE